MVFGSHKGVGRFSVNALKQYVHEKKSMFCEKCGTLGVPTAKGLVCPTCGGRVKSRYHAQHPKKVEPRPLSGRVPKQEGSIEHECKRCGHSHSSFDVVPPTYGDEYSTFFFKCPKCGYVERDEIVPM
ncbi:hypothetical protein COT72_01960 [archaeon CG10_big_fil_rev_8_21_14_0_10_43_11]|nr:MAG: hypothetical protein COT72_01960 [archaeon CG10_big_fil_rev_8_21_14_0_10_43_11]